MVELSADSFEHQPTQISDTKRILENQGTQTLR